jgi:hypothetical protein
MKLNLPKNWFKKTDTYFYLLPAAAALWALTAVFVFHPASVRAWDEKQQAYEQAEEWIGKILDLEPQRLQYKEQKGGSSEFDYSDEVDKFSKLFGISTSNYTLTTRDTMKHAGKRSKSADMIIKSEDIETTCKFISAMLIRWPDLQCEQLTLEKLSSGKNDWKVKLRFTYYF